MSKKNLINNDNWDTWYKVTKRNAMFLLDHPGLPLWAKVLNRIILEVEFEQGYVSTSFVKQLSVLFQTEEKQIHRAIARLIDDNLLLKYPFGAKRAKGYMINPEHFWLGSDESKQQKITIYRNTINKLLIEIDSTDNENVEIKIIDRKLSENVNTQWNKNYDKLNVE